MNEHGVLIQAVEAEIESSTSVFDLAEKLEKLLVQDEILYLEIEHMPGNKSGDDDQFDDEEELVIIGDKDSGSHSYFLRDGIGYGSRNCIDTVVVQLQVARLVDVTHVVFYIKQVIMVTEF